MPSISKKKSLRKKFKQHFMSALQKNKSTQTSGSVFAERTEKAKKTTFELELLKIVDCFLDGHGNDDGTLVYFKIKFFYNVQYFLLQLVRVMSVTKEYRIIVKNEIPNQKSSSLVKFWNNFFTTGQVSNQVFYNASDFKANFSQCARI